MSSVVSRSVPKGVMLGLLMAAGVAGGAELPATDATRLAEHRALIAAMKTSERGPFSRIRYFCHDGQVLEPKAYACEKFGGGYQRGEWSADTQRLRAAGYPIANLLVTVEPARLAGPAADRELLGVLLVERFLVAQDNGWILRRAQYYRGAVQDHNEKEAAGTLLAALAAQPATPFIEFREAARGFPHGADTAGLRRVRDLAAAVNAKDAAFAALRARIHNAPEAGDAGRVRDYAAARPAGSPLQADYAALVAAIDEAYRPRALASHFAALRKRLPMPQRAELEALLATRAAAETGTPATAARLQSAADLLVWLQDRAWPAATGATRLAVADASVATENTFLVESPPVLAALGTRSRAERLQLLALATQALYGTGLLTDRETASMAATLKELDDQVRLGRYRENLEYLERVASWSARRLDYHFGAGVARLAPLEPLAEGFVADRLRASPLLFHSAVLQTLREDADRLGQVGQQLFGKPVATGLRRLNPGLARGVLRTAVARDATEPAVYLVPATTAELPPAAGILTEHEGNPVSHVQLLARNLGIPNVVIGDQWLPALRQREGRRVVIAASPGGRIEISDDTPAWDAVLGRGAPGSGVHIVPELAKLDLTRAEFIPTSALRASASGRIVGPKAAHVGELAHRFPGHVAPGVAVSFGVFRQMLDQPFRNAGGPSMFDWMRGQYADIGARRLLDPAQHPARVRALLATVRDWIAQAPIPAPLQWRLHEAMRSEFGLDGTYGVFVRSDTNIEDLPGFTGAGLNKTVPNVVGFDATVAALRQVWASPFAERAYGWRQDLMDAPEHVYVSVLLHRSVPNQKSGVMITADVDSGDRSKITVATSAGVGGGVDGDAAESLLVDLDGGKVRLLASASARVQRVLPRAGGAELVPASAPRVLLTAREIAALAKFARELPRAYPELRDEAGEPAPADVEFGFIDGRLTLQQIRPFLQNRSAARQEYLAKMDSGLRRSSDRRIDLSEAPEAGKT